MNPSPGKIKMRRHSSPGCRITQKSASMDDHHYFPSSNDFPRFRSLSGCRITEKNKHMGGYQFTYPIIEGPKGLKVNEQEFHCRVTAKYRAMSGFKYVYPVPIKVDIQRDDLVTMSDDKIFVPTEVDKLIPGGVKEILKSQNGEAVYIECNDGTLVAAAVKSIGQKKLKRSKTLPVHLEIIQSKDTVEEVKITQETIPERDVEPIQMSWLAKFSLDTKYANNTLVDFGEYRRCCEEEITGNGGKNQTYENELEKDMNINNKILKESDAQLTTNQSICVKTDDAKLKDKEADDRNTVIISEIGINQKTTVTENRKEKSCDGKEMQSCTEQQLTIENAMKEKSNDKERQDEASFNKNQALFKCIKLDNTKETKKNKLKSEIINEDISKTTKTNQMETKKKVSKGRNHKEDIPHSEVKNHVEDLPVLVLQIEKNHSLMVEELTEPNNKNNKERTITSNQTEKLEERKLLKDTEKKKGEEKLTNSINETQNSTEVFKTEISLTNNKEMNTKSITTENGIKEDSEIQIISNNQPIEDLVKEITEISKSKLNKLQSFNREADICNLEIKGKDLIELKEETQNQKDNDTKTAAILNTEIMALSNTLQKENGFLIERITRRSHPRNDNLAMGSEKKETIVPSVGQNGVLSLDCHLIKNRPGSSGWITDDENDQLRIEDKNLSEENNHIENNTKQNITQSDVNINLTLRTHNLITFFHRKDSSDSSNSSMQNNTPVKCPLLKELPYQQEHIIVSLSSLEQEEVKREAVFNMSQTRDVYVAIMDFNPLECDIGAIPMKCGQEVEIIDSSKPRKWLVKSRPLKDLSSQEGWVPTCYLEKKTSSMADISSLTDTRTDPKEREAVMRREAVVKELVETEEDFARDMQYVVDNYYLEMDNKRMPKELRDQRDLLFTNFKPICEFHNNVLIKGVQYYAKEPALLGKTFLRLERDFDMHVNYCRDEAHSQQLLKSGPLKNYFDEHSKRIGDDKTLSEHLKLPIQRINDYQLLLRELLKYTSRLKEDTADLQKALDFMACIPQRSADLKYLNAMQGYKGNIHKLGRLLKHGWLEVTEASKPKQERYVFLFKAHIFITEVKNISSGCDNYLVKNIIKLQDAEIVEKVNEDEKVFKIQHKKKTHPDYPIIFRAASYEQKDTWIRELVSRSVVEDLGEDEPQLIPEEIHKLMTDEPQLKKAKMDPEVENTESDVKSLEMEEECTDAKIPSLTSDIKIELPEEEGTANITESLRSESISSLEDIEGGNPKQNPSKPQFQKSLRAITCLQGEMVTFECVVIATPQAVVKWLKNNKPIAKSQRVKSASQGNKYTLTFKEAIPEDAGLYTAMASNDHGFVACSATLNVKQELLGVPKEDSRPTTPGGTELPHAPVFKVKLKDTELLEGTSVRFELVVRGYPKPKITFYKDSKELIEDDRVRVSYESGEVFELILDHVTASDAGQYSCTAFNIEGKDTTTGVIKVTKHKILFKGLEEELERPPTPKPFKWFKDGKDFEASERFQVSFSEEEDSLALVFQRVTPDDAGLYTCVASTVSGNKISCSAELTVQGAIHKLLKDPVPPAIKANLTDVEVSEGASAMLELKVCGYPKPTVTWFKDGEEVKAGDRIRFLFEDDESFTLIIKNVKKADAGKYSITAKNDLGEVNESCKLTVTCPPSFRKKLKDMAVMTNEPVRFEVEVEGKPTPEVKWYKDGQQLSENQRIKMLNDAEEIFAMMIEKAKPEDSGNYSCVLTNESGSQAGYSNLVVNAPPSFVKEMKNVECSEEETISFSLKTAGNPKPTLKWSKDGNELKIDGKHIKVVEEENGSYTLTIDKVQKEDFGNYSCEVTNQYGTASTSGTLTTKGSKPAFTKKLSDIEVKEGDVNVEFTVKVEGSPQSKIKWKIDNMEITEKKNYKIISDERKGTYTLKIEEVTSEASGKYTCEASNVHGSAATSGILTVCKPPHFVQKLKDVVVEEEENVSMTVKFSGHPKPSIKWFKDDEELKVDNKHVVIKEEAIDSCTLTLKKISKTDRGKYTCKISNKFGEESTSGTLNVREADGSEAPNFVKKLNNQVAVVGDAARFEVQVTGNPKPQISWFKDGTELKESTNVKFSSDGDCYSLTLTDITLQNGGSYSCRAKNDKGEESSKAELTVKEPTAPVIEGCNDVQVELGEVAKFNVKVTGFPLPEIKWYKDDKQVQASEHVVITSDKETNSYGLAVKKVKQEDVGVYSCVASNSAGTSRSEGKLSTIERDLSAPNFVKKMSDQIAVVGDAARFEVQVTGKPRPQISWFKDGTELKESTNVKFSSDGDCYSLTLTDITLQNGGSYSCRAKNDIGEASSKAELTIKEPTAPVIEGCNDVEVELGEVAKFNVKVTGFPLPEIKWYKDDKQVQASEHVVITSDKEKNSYGLAVKKVKQEDVGVYSCVASNSAGKSRSEGKLSIIERDLSAPNFVKKMSDQIAVVGDAARFEVQVTGKPRPQISWFKDETELQENANTKFSSDGNCYSLTLRDLALQNGGSYLCKAKNEIGEALDKAVLTVKEPSAPKIEGSGDLEVELGAVAKFNVKVTGLPVPAVKWSKADKLILESDQIVITTDKENNNYSLAIRKVKQEDVGVYVCIATNSAGTAQCEGKLSVKDAKPIPAKPSFAKKLKPTDLIIGQAGKLEAKVSGEPQPKITWLKNGEELSPDDHITFQQEPDGTIALVIDSVTPDDIGSFSVVAVNDNGDAMTTAQVSAKSPPGEKPGFISSLKPTQFQEGQPGRLQVKISGEPMPSVKWLKDGKEVIPSNHFTIMEEQDGTINLLIDKVSPDDAGSYAVVISNEHGEIKSEAPITTISPVTGQKPEILVQLKTTNVLEGQPLKLQAKISGEPSSVKWLKNGEEIEPSNQISITTEPDGTFSLVVDKANLGDAGKYSIVATNALGKAYSSSLIDVQAVSKEKPEIIGNLEPLTVKKGESGKLSAKVIGEDPEIKWMKDGNEIIPSDRIKITKEPDGTVALVIENMSAEDAGKYSVLAGNKHGENRSTAPILVTHPPCFIKSLKPIKVVEGYPAKFDVQFAGVPTPDVKWVKDGKEIIPDNERIIMSTNPDGSMALTIKKCTPEDEGEYKCVAYNPSGESDSSGNLSVKEKAKVQETEATPSIVNPLKDVTVKEGDPMVLEAQISGFPIPDVTWYLDGQPLHPSETVLPMFDGEKAILEIKQSQPKHAGTFECRLSNPLGEVSSSGKVNVVERQAPRFIQQLCDTNASTSQPAKFSCRVRGDPEPEIKWYYNNSPIEHGLKYNIVHEGQSCTLTILNPKVQDRGIYECHAINPAGKDISSAQISFSDKTEKGEAPMFLKKIGDAEALEGMTVKFTACITGIPQPDVKWYKDEKLLDSTARCKIEQESTGILRLIIRDVESSDFAEYTVDISNIHGRDSCKASLRQESLEPKYPMKPIGDQYVDFDKFRKSGAPVPLPNKPFIIRMTDNYLTLGWKPSIPIAPRIPVTYQVEMCRHPGGEWATYKIDIKDCLCDIRNLEPEQDYRFRIRVESKYGVSDPSPYVTAHRGKLADFKPPCREYEPMDYEIEHPELDKHVEAPRFIRKEEDIMYGVRGQPVTIEFWVYGYPEPEITWYFDGNPMEKDKFDFLHDRNGKVAVFLPAMGDADVGTYVCHATNDLGDARQKISLQIAEAPSIIERLDRTSIMSRRSGRLQCRVTGLPYPKIKWYKDWFPIYDSSRFQILWEEPDKCTLFLNGVISKDAGLYSCSASNLAGTISCSAMVTVEESELEHSLLTYNRPNVVKPRGKPFEDFYDIGDELGRGTQAIIHHTVQRASGKSYAAKMMHGKGRVRDFMNAEMDIMNHLSHPQLVRLWDVFESKSALTLITDLCDGGELLENILRRGKLRERDAANYIKQVLEGLQHMHSKNIGHLGLTIGDILVNHVNSDLIKIGDFGLAAHLHPEKEYFLDYGHPEFVAPEISNKQAVTLAADMWSIGVITYLLLSGISPFLAENDMETLKKVQQGKINFFPDSFIGVSDDAKDFMSKLLVFDPSDRMDVKMALQHRWLTGEYITDGDVYLNNIDRLRDYHRKWKEWYANASCKRFYRRRPLESCFTHPSRMIYPPGEEYTPPSSPEPELDRSHIKPAEYDDTYKQKICREAIDFRSETNYQNGPDTYLLQHRDTDFPLRIREYLRVGASISPSLATSLCDTHWGDSMVTVRERRRFVDIMDEEIDDEQGGRGTRTIPMRLHHEFGTTSYAREQMEMLKKEVWKDKGSREIEIGYTPYFREKISDAVIQEDQQAVFTCHAVGEPAPVYSWFRNDGILLESTRIQIELKNGTCQLKLNPGKAYDVGSYKCVARNLHGEAVCRARLKLGTIPDRPDIPNIDQYSDTAVYVTWRVPRYAGNTTILCYRVEYNKAGETDWITIASNISHEFYVIHKLTPSTTYHFRVSAMNKFGWSLPSLPTESVTTLTEGAPKIKITKARKYQQEMTEQSDQLPDDHDEEPEIDYSIEKNPISLTEGKPSDLYNFVSEITRGKYSIIMKSWIKDLSSTSVTKIIQGTAGHETDGKKEYEIHKSLRHKNIVQLLSASFYENETILVMEKLTGMDVLSYLTSHTEYSEETVSEIIIQVLDALEYLHFRGICYLELQPDNVVMTSEKYPYVKLVDFGNAHFVPKAGGKVDVKGKLEYLAPEIINHENVYTSTDVWAVGVLTYILLSGCSPFRGQNDEETTSNISFVRYHFDNLHKEVTVEATRFLIQTFKKCPIKRPTVAECLENKWLLPSEFMLRKRESAIFLSHRLHEFAEEFHTEKESSTVPELMDKFGTSFSKSVTLEVDAYEEI